MKRRIRARGMEAVLAILIFTSFTPGPPQETSAGEVIDKTNWKNAEALVPAPLLEWVEVGEFVLPVGDLSFDPAEYFLPYALESRSANQGRYDLNEKSEIIEVDTGKPPEYILGFPFPEIDPEDPNAAAKIIYNKFYANYVTGMKRFLLNVVWIGRSGYQRDVVALYRDAPMTGLLEAKGLPNPRRIERYSIISVREPYDLAGTSQMLWRYVSSKQDMNYAYVPAIRRVRRTTPANRSDGFLGSDGSVDDITAYNGKVAEFEWKLVGRQDVLAPFQCKDPIRVVPTKQGEWRQSTTVAPTRMGYEDDGWTGAPWCPMNLVYVKRPAWVIEATPKDPYYNSGPQMIWLDVETMGPLYKLVKDRTGVQWKFGMITTLGYESQDESVRFLAWTDHFVVDMRRNHATQIKLFDPKVDMVFFAKLDLNDFSLAGFQKYCK